MKFDEFCGSTVGGAAESWSLVAGGDVCPVARIEKSLLEDGPEAIMGHGVLRALQDSDITLINLESPVCSQAGPIPKTGPNFISSPGVIEPLKAAGVDIVALANNHILDQGVRGLEETIKILDSAGIRSHGAGLTLEQAAAPARVRQANQSIAFFNVAEGEFAVSRDGGPGAAPLDTGGTCSRIRGAALDNDLVIVTAHAGNEYQPYPSPFLQDVYRRYIEAGAGVVIGHHPHIPQGVEMYGKGIIAYSLGNFLFDYEGHVGNPCTKIGFLIRFGFHGCDVVSVRLLPYRTQENAAVSLLGGNDIADFAEYMNEVSAPLELPGGLSPLWEQETVSLFGTTYMPLFRSVFEEMRENDGQGKQPIEGLSASAMFNVFRCEAHREAVKTAFRLMHENRFAANHECQNRINGVLDILEKLYLPGKEGKGIS